VIDARYKNIVKIGPAGSTCSIIGVVLLLVYFLAILSRFQYLGFGLGIIAAWGIILMNQGILLYSMLGLGITGLILGIISEAKNEARVPGIAAIVIGSIDILFALLILGSFLVV
jgi:hypothetical protein